MDGWHGTYVPTATSMDRFISFRWQMSDGGVGRVLLFPKSLRSTLLYSTLTDLALNARFCLSLMLFVLSQNLFIVLPCHLGKDNNKSKKAEIKSYRYSKISSKKREMKLLLSSVTALLLLLLLSAGAGAGADAAGINQKRKQRRLTPSLSSSRPHHHHDGIIADVRDAGSAGGSAAGTGSSSVEVAGGGTNGTGRGGGGGGTTTTNPRGRKYYSSPMTSPTQKVVHEKNKNSSFVSFSSHHQQNKDENKGQDHQQEHQRRNQRQRRNQQSDLTQSKHSWCGSADPTPQQIQDADLVEQLYKEQQEEESSRRRRRRRHLVDGDDGDDDDIITVPVCHHFIYPFETNQEDYLQDEMFENWTERINVGFSSSSCCNVMEEYWCNGECSVDTTIRFVTDRSLVGGPSTTYPCITHTKSDFWYTGGPDWNTDLEREMKTALRMGGSDVLNIYYTLFWDENLLGFASFPSDYNLDPAMDGVMMNMAPFADDDDFFVRILVHEAGHWMGLYHTFHSLNRSGGGCDEGDDIQDTAAESHPNYSCPIGSDSCPEIDGEDPIHNWMDYTSTSCAYEFTPGQVDRMRAHWELFRDPNSGQDTETVIDVADVDPDAPPETTFDLLVQGQKSLVAVETPVGATLYCTTSSADGDVDLYMRNENVPDVAKGLYDCASLSPGVVQDVCSVDVPETDVSGDTDIVHIAILAFKTSTDITLACTIEDNGITQPPEPELEEDIVVLEDGTLFELVDGMSAGTQLQFSVQTTTTGFVTCETWAWEDDEDVDLYVRLDEAVDLTSGGYDCFQASSESYESCKLVPVASLTTVFGSTYAYSDATYVGAMCSSFSGITENPTIELTSEEPSEPFRLRTYQIQDFTIQTPDNSDVMCVLEGIEDGIADADLYLRWDEEPVLDGFNLAYDCFSEELGSSEECTVINPGTSTVLYVRVSAFYTFSAAVLTCTIGTVSLTVDNDDGIAIDREDGADTGSKTLSSSDEGGANFQNVPQTASGTLDLSSGKYEYEFEATTPSSSRTIGYITSFMMVMLLSFGAVVVSFDI